MGTFDLQSRDQTKFWRRANSTYGDGDGGRGQFDDNESFSRYADVGRGTDGSLSTTFVSCRERSEK